LDVYEFLIDENATMIEAMQQLDRISTKVLFVTKDGCFAAALTDGDIRRWILRKGNLDAHVRDIGNYNPRFLAIHEKSNAKEYMRRFSIEALPIVDENRNIVSVVLWTDQEIKAEKNLNIPIVIMAGGLGTRLYPYTKVLPKPLIPVGEIPIVEHIINRFVLHNAHQFYLVVNHKKNMIKAYFNEIEKDYSIEYIDEDIPLGTGGGLSLLKGKITESFFLTNCDILIEEDYEKILKFHKEEKNTITIVCSLKNVKIPYGVIEIGPNGEIESMKEKPEFSFITNTGMYIVEPKVIEELNDEEAIGFPDVVEKYRKSGERVGVFPISEKSWMDMGQLDDLEEMRRRLSREEQ
jgi:dTDP-glucose pyrophosphorylase